MGSPEASGAPARRALVVEDDQAINRLLVDALVDEGFEVRTAVSGIAALEILGSWVPDLILLDLMLPDMDGRAFRSAQLSLESPAASVPVVLVTGAHDPTTLAEELSAAALLRKPFDLDDLVELAERLAASRN